MLLYSSDKPERTNFPHETKTSLWPAGRPYPDLRTVKAAPSRVVPVQVDGTVLSQGVNYLQSGVTYVPLRGLLDAFGGWSVWWDSSRKVAAAASGSQSVTANPSRNTVTVNGRTYSGKVFVSRGRTYIPLRTLATPWAAAWSGIPSWAARR